MPIFNRRPTAKKPSKHSDKDKDKDASPVAKRKHREEKLRRPTVGNRTTSKESLSEPAREGSVSSSVSGNATPSPELGEAATALGPETKRSATSGSARDLRTPSRSTSNVSSASVSAPRRDSAVVDEQGIKDYRKAGVALPLPDVKLSRDGGGTRRTVVIRRQEQGGFGFRLRQEPGAAGSPPVHVVEANRPDSAAASVLLPGDRLVAVNGIDVEHSSHTQIVEIIKNGGSELKLLVVSVLSELANVGEGGSHSNSPNTASVSCQCFSFVLSRSCCSGGGVPRVVSFCHAWPSKMFTCQVFFPPVRDPSGPARSYPARSPSWLGVGVRACNQISQAPHRGFMLYLYKVNLIEKISPTCGS